MAFKTPPGEIPLAEQLRRRIRHISARLAREVSRRGYNASDWQALNELARMENGATLSVTELGLRADLSKSAVSRVVRKLTEAGLVTRMEVENDRRLSAIAITARGREQHATPNERMYRGTHRAFDSLPDEDRIALARILDACLAPARKPR